MNTLAADSISLNNIAMPQINISNALLSPIAETTIESRPAQAAQTPTLVKVAKPAEATTATANDTAMFMLGGLSDSHLLHTSDNRPTMDMKNIGHTHHNTSTEQQVTTIRAIDNNTSTLEYKPLGETIIGADSVWIFAMTLIPIIIVGFVKARSTNFISQLLSLTFSSFHWRTVTESIVMQNYWHSRLLHISFYIVISLLIYEMTAATGSYIHNILPKFEIYLAILVTCIGFYIVKFAINKLISFTFDIPEKGRHITQRKILATDIFGIIAIPLVIIFPFVPESTYPALTIITCGIMILMYLWRIIKTSEIILTDYLSVLYSLLYLCTVELIPIACIYKTASIVIQ